MLDNPSTEGLTLVTAKLKNGVPIMNQGLQNNYNRLTIEFGKIEATKSIIRFTWELGFFGWTGVLEA